MKQILEIILVVIILSFALFGAGILIRLLLGYDIDGKCPDGFEYPTPVEKEIIDTLYITRDNIITKVKYLDSIKYDTIEKVYVLNDTASIDLFYKLVSE